MNHWANNEAATADIGDLRLNERMAKTLGLLGDHPLVSIPAACGGLAETLGAYRFFDNPKVNFEKVLAPHRDATIKRMASVPVVLLAQDTTVDDDTLNLGPKGLGTIKNTKKISQRLHPTIAFTPERICLGVVKVTYWARDKPSPRKERHSKGIDEKESFRWVDSYQDSCALQGLLPNTIVVSVGDRENDIYELFVEYESYEAVTRADWLVRATQNRLLAEEYQGQRKLKEALNATPSLGEMLVEVKRKNKQPARQAKVTVRSATVPLAAPSRVGYKFDNLIINAVLVREENPPAGTTPLEWLLLTSLPVGTFDQAWTIVEWYTVRWCIEVYFHVLKSGCQMKDLQLETLDRKLACLALYMIITWRTMFTTMLGRMCPDVNCEVLFEPMEWKAAYIVLYKKSPPSTPPSLGEMITVVACLGGYMNRKHDDPPGPKVIWRGLQLIKDYAVALEALESLKRRCV